MSASLIHNPRNLFLKNSDNPEDASTPAAAVRPVRVRSDSENQNCWRL